MEDQQRYLDDNEEDLRRKNVQRWRVVTEERVQLVDGGGKEVQKVVFRIMSGRELDY